MGKPQSWEVKCLAPVTPRSSCTGNPQQSITSFAAHLWDKEITSLGLGASSYLSKAFSFNHGATPWVFAVHLAVSSPLCHSTAGLLGDWVGIISCHPEDKMFKYRLFPQAGWMLPGWWLQSLSRPCSSNETERIIYTSSHCTAHHALNWSTLCI